MPKEKQKLTKDKDFERVFKSGRSAYAPFLLLKYLKNKIGITRFGIIVSAKVSKKAVLRNLAKRRIREILRLNKEKIKKGFDIIIVVSPKIVSQSGKILKYQEIEKTLLNLLKKADLL